MAGREITVDTLILGGDIEELRTTLSRVRAQLDSMFGEVAELDRMWDGPANAVFNKQFSGDYANAKNMCSAIESLIGCMEYARDQYNSCENDVNGIVSAIKI